MEDEILKEIKAIVRQKKDTTILEELLKNEFIQFCRGQRK